MNDKMGHNYRPSRYFKNNAGECTSLDLFGCKQKQISLFLTLTLQRYNEKYSVLSLKEISSKFHNFSSLLENKIAFIFSNKSPVQFNVNALNFLKDLFLFQRRPGSVFSKCWEWGGWLPSPFPFFLPFPTD